MKILCADHVANEVMLESVDQKNSLGEVLRTAGLFIK